MRKAGGVLAGLTAVLGVAALSGWVFGIRWLSSAGPDYIPMAPSTALGFVLCAGALLALYRWPSGPLARRLVPAASSLVAVFSGLVLAAALRGTTLTLEQVLVRTDETVAGAPVGHMSPLTAASFLAVAAAMILLRRAALSRSTWLGVVGLAAVVVGASLVLLLGYWLGTPLLYGGPVVPVALTTSTAFLSLGLAILAAAGGESSWRVAYLPAALVVVIGSVLSLAAYGMVEAGGGPIGRGNSWHAHGVLALGLALTALLAAYLVSVLRHSAKTRRALAAVQRSEAALRSLVENSPEPMWVYDLGSARFLAVNPAAVERYGYSRKEFLAMRVTDIEVSGDLPRLSGDAERQRSRRRSAGESRHRLKSGEIIDVAVSAQTLGFESREAVLVIAYDITGRRRAETLQAALYEISEAAHKAANLKELLTTIHVAVSRLLDAASFYVALRDAQADLLTFPYFSDEFDENPGTVDPAGTLTGYVLRTGQPLLATPQVRTALEEAGEVTPHGTPPLDWLGVPLTSHGQVFGVLVVQSYQETTRYGDRERDALVFVSHRVSEAIERLRAAEALRQSEERFGSLVRSSIDGIVATDSSGKVVVLNAAAAKMFGYEPAEAVGQPLEMLMPARLRAGHLRGMARLRETGQARLLGRVVELEGLRKDGSEFPIEMALSSWGQGDDTWYAAFIRDITERHETHSRLLQAQRLEAISRLTAGVAHEYNNALQSMLATAEMLRARRLDLEAFTAAFAELEDLIKTSTSTTRQLVLFSQAGIASREDLDIGELIGESARLFARGLPANVHVQLDLAAEPLPVNANRGQLQQVLANLLANAGDVMPGGGTVVVRSGSAGNGDVWFEVIDGGAGIPDEVRAHLFEPFFTTKGSERGTGLGLAASHGIVVAHGGRIEVASSPGEGSTFRVVLPPAARRTPAAPPRPAAGRSEVRPAGPRRVLVVEDEDLARKGLLEVLDLLGYEVTAVASGEEALRLSDGPPFDTLLTDLKLPGVQGAEVARRLAARWPALKIVLMSGYADDVALRDGVASGNFRFLQKPFDMKTLAAELGADLGEA
jgi:PAS domain S-box-containing protein